jgi:hypothetical protein
MRPVRHERHLEPPCLQTASGGRELVQLGHAVRARALAAHDGDEVAFELAGLNAAASSCSSKTVAGASIDRGDPPAPRKP